jgi:Fe-S-cluster containining protein
VVLRVDELGKLGGEPCPHILPEGGCGIYETRPRICRGYRCLWLQGGHEESDRPDALGAVLDFMTTGTDVRLGIQEARPGAFEESPRLHEIADGYRETGPVRVVEAGNVLDPDRPYRVLLADGHEQRVRGEWVAEYRFGEKQSEYRIPWIERIARRVALAIRGLRLRLARRFGRIPAADE